MSFLDYFMLLIDEKVDILFDWSIGDATADAFIGEFFPDVVGVFPFAWDFFND